MQRITPVRTLACSGLVVAATVAVAMIILVLSGPFLDIASAGANLASPVNLNETSFIFIFPHSHVEPIRDEQLLALDAKALWQARNEIFARKGYIFKSPRAATFFGNLPYYSGHKKQVTLNQVEKTNVELIQRFESYMKENPDLEFETSYSVKGVFNVRACPSAGAHLLVGGSLLRQLLQ